MTRLTAVPLRRSPRQGNDKNLSRPPTGLTQPTYTKYKKTSIRFFPQVDRENCLEDGALFVQGNWQLSPATEGLVCSLPVLFYCMHADEGVRATQAR